MSQNAQKFETWAIIELFGHQKIAGYCTEQNIAGTNMLRVDVPETKEQPEYTRLLNNAAIYAINPVDEITARYMADRINVAPIQVWQVSEVVAKQSIALPEPGTEAAARYITGDDE